MFLVKPVLAQCPVCIVTIGGGMFIAQKLGIDDFLVSIWISALNTAISFWLATKFKIKLLNNPWFLSILMFGLALFYFDTTGQINDSANKLLGLDKIVLGHIVGLLSVFLGNFIYGFSKYKNNHRALFPYSKVVFPVSVTLIVTFVLKMVFAL